MWAQKLDIQWGWQVATHGPGLISNWQTRLHLITWEWRKNSNYREWSMTIIADRMVNTSNLGAQGPARDVNVSLKLTKLEQKSCQCNCSGLSGFWQASSVQCSAEAAECSSQWLNKSDGNNLHTVNNAKKGGTLEVIWHSIMFPSPIAHVHACTHSPRRWSGAAWGQAPPQWGRSHFGRAFPGDCNFPSGHDRASSGTLRRGNLGEV